MKIVLFTEIFDCGGVDTFIINLINEWPISGDTFIIVANANYPGLALIEERVSRPLKVIRHTYTIYANIGLDKPLLRRAKRMLSPALRYGVLAANVIAFMKLLKQTGADRLMVVNGGYPGGDSCRAATIAWGLIPGKHRSIHNFHNLAQPTAWHSQWQDGLVDRLVARSTDAFVTVSAASAHSMQVRPAIAATGRVSFIYNGYSRPVVAPDFKPTLRYEMGLDSGTPLCLMLGTYEPRKGHAFLLDAWRLVLQSVPQAHLVICGFGFPEEVRDVQALVAQRGLGSCVHLMDFRRDLGNLLGSTDILVVASQAFESFGYTSVEAMAHRVPVVATDVGGVPEVVVSDDGGYCISKDDTQGFAQAIVRLLEDPALRRAQGERGYARYRAHFSSSVMSARYAELLHPAEKVGRPA